MQIPQPELEALFDNIEKYRQADFKSLVLENDSLEQAALDYLTKILDLPTIFKGCDQTVSWNDFYSQLTTDSAKYAVLVPFYWSLLRGNYQTGDPAKDQLVPIQFGGLEPNALLTWRFMFETFSPVVMLATLFELMTGWIDLIAPNAAQLAKHSLLCNYITEFIAFATDLDLAQVCNSYLESWNDIPANLTPNQQLEFMTEYLRNGMPALPLSWYIYHDKADELDQMAIAWIGEHIKNPEDKSMTEKCNEYLRPPTQMSGVEYGSPRSMAGITYSES